MAQSALSIHQVTKSYGATVALRNLSLTVRRGELHGLVGENGAGKSTLVKILSGVISRDSGRIEIEDGAFRPGTLMEAHAVGVSTAGRLQRLGAIDRKRERACVADGAQRVQLSEHFLDRSMAELSGGNQQKALISEEPASAPCTGVSERSLDAPITAMSIVAVPEEFALVTQLPRIASQLTSIAIGVPTIWLGERPDAGPA